MSKQKVKVKLTEPGFGNFTGVMGEITFEDGVSVESVEHWLAERLGSAMRVHTVDATGKEGASPGVSQQILESGTVAMGSTKEEVAEAPRKPSQGVLALPVRTREELEAIADDKGIQGLRDEVAPYDVKGRKIAEIIDAAMQKQRALGLPVDKVVEQEETVEETVENPGDQGKGE